jgi:hypothetical protein
MKSLLGGNLEGPADFGRQMMFINIVKTARKFGSAETPYDGKGVVDALGNPTGDCGITLFTEQVNHGGTYKFSCSGICTPQLAGTRGTVKNLAFNPAINRTTADIVLDANATQAFIRIVGTKGGVKNIKMLRPGYTDDDAVFTTDFLKMIEPFGALRFMDLLRTNNSVITKWSERPTFDTATYSTNGIPYEVAIDLCNQTGKDCWINIPAGVDDAFLDELAKLLKDRLGKNTNCYIEYSNEVWNTIFSQEKINREKAMAEAATGDKYYTTTNQWYQGWARTARMAVKAKLACNKYMPNDSRIRVVLAGQIANNATMEHGLFSVDKFYGPPKNYFYAIAGAPYFGHVKEFCSRTDLTAGDFFGPYEFDRLNSDGSVKQHYKGLNYMMDRAVASTTGDGVKGMRALAKQYGVKALCYEGGVDLGQYNTSLPAKLAAQDDPRMGDAVRTNLTKWFEGSADPFFYFTVSSGYGKYGYWGLTQDPRNLTVPKYAAAKTVADRFKESTPVPSSSSSTPPPSSSSSTPALKIAVNLLDTTNGKIVSAVSEGQSIDLNGKNRTIAFTPSSAVGSLRLIVDGSSRVEKTFPYHVAGDFVPWNPASGKHTLQALAYASKDGSGPVLGQVALSVVALAAPLPSSSSSSAPQPPSSSSSSSHPSSSSAAEKKIASVVVNYTDGTSLRIA